MARSSSGHPAVLAIDQGTSGTKAVVVDGGGAVLAVAERPVHPQYRSGGAVEQDPAELLHSVLEAGREAVAAAGAPVAGVALANQGETVLAWDPDDGRPLSPAIVWQDRRAETVVGELDDARGWVAERTGLVLDPYFSAPKMAWLRRNVTGAGVVTTSDTWLVHQLCGAFVTDAATAGRSLLTGLDSTDWDDDLCALFGWSAEPVPDIVDCDAVVGRTDAFGPTLAVGGLVVDQQAALLGESCLTPGTAKCTFGTGAFLLANTGSSAVRSGSGLSCSPAWRIGGRATYCLDGQVYAAGSAVRWLTGLGLIEAPTQLDSRCAAADPDDAALFVPALAGLGAPWWRPAATAAFAGMTLSTGPAELVAAVVRSIAATVAELASLVGTDTGAPIERLRVDGGLTHSAALMQCTADLLQTPVDVYPGAHATALGVAALGRLALSGGGGLDLADVVTPWTPARTFEPQWSARQAHDHQQRWQAAVAANVDLGRNRT